MSFNRDSTAEHDWLNGGSGTDTIFGDDGEERCRSVNTGVFLRRVGRFSDRRHRRRLAGCRGQIKGLVSLRNAGSRHAQPRFSSVAWRWKV